MWGGIHLQIYGLQIVAIFFSPQTTPSFWNNNLCYQNSKIPNKHPSKTFIVSLGAIKRQKQSERRK